jgi:tRNA threonylcarbamoyladenosine biosynthesis protein TsaE
MSKRFSVSNLEQYREPAQYIIDLMNHHTVFLLEGELGAGKTTLVQHICKMLETSDVVSSPTFALINPYETSKGMIYHMDMYRIESVEEAIDFGVEEYLWDGHFCFIEWPERIERILPDDYVRIEIEQQAADVRNIIVTVVRQNF